MLSTYIHYLNLPKDREIGPDKFSFAEEEIEYIMLDQLIDKKRSNDEKILMIIGILEGLRSALRSRAT
jgi:hypothetical protein